MTSPYHRWLLWRNPFGELTRQERGELAVVDDLDEWLRLLADSRLALQFVGDCGYGKTTHLLAIGRRLAGAPYVYYPEVGPRPRLPEVRPVIIDEAQRMGFWQRRRMLRGGGPLIIASHVDLSHPLKRAGFRPRTILFDQPMQPATLARILNRRIEASRLEAPQLASFSPVVATQSVAASPADRLWIDDALAARLLDRFGPNIRAIEHFLYVELQNCLSGSSTWPPALSRLN